MTKIRCSNCGKKIDQEIIGCPYCGAINHMSSHYAHSEPETAKNVNFFDDYQDEEQEVPQKPAANLYNSILEEKTPAANPYNPIPEEKTPAANPYNPIPEEKKVAANPYNPIPEEKKVAANPYNPIPEEKRVNRKPSRNGNKSKKNKKTVAVVTMICLIILLPLIVIIIFMMSHIQYSYVLSNIGPFKAIQENREEKWREENYPIFDRLYSDGHYDQIYNLFCEKVMDPGYSPYEWEHYDFIELFSNYDSFRKDKEQFLEKEVLVQKWVIYDAVYIEYVYNSTFYNITPEEKEIIEGWMKECNQFFEEDLGMTSKEIEDMKNYITGDNSIGFPSSTLCEEYATKHF